MREWLLGFSVVLGFLVSSQSAALQSQWRLPVTIEAVRDVTIQRPVPALNRRRPRGVLDGPNHDPIIIKKAQQFLMVEITGEGGCVIEFERQRYTQSSCWWLDGFTDHQEDFFRVHLPADRKPPAPEPPR